jgi:hypothetical protein
MSGKDEHIFTKAALLSTRSGKEILKRILLRENGYKQFTKYKQKYEKEFGDFTKRFLMSLRNSMTLKQDYQDPKFLQTEYRGF